MLTSKDRETLKKRNITEEKFLSQLEMLRDGFPYLKIEAPATTENGIKNMSEPECEKNIQVWEKYLDEGGKVVKMVPASGAASRMFKNLFSFADGKSMTPDSDFISTFCNEIEKFAFFPMLNRKVLDTFGKSINTLFNEGRHRDVVNTLLREEGLNYGQLPKALLEFHKIMGATRTPLEEHLSEGAEYASEADGKVNVHFTVSEDHLPIFTKKLEECKGILENATGRKFEVTMSVQKPSTDTVAALPDGEPYREDGNLFFRPGGHGALIENLNDLESPVVFLKNIDNVVPDAKRGISNRYKKIIGGVLIENVTKIHEYIRCLQSGDASDATIDDIFNFLHNALCITHDGQETMSREEKIAYLLRRLNRPVRVCGMVRNEGEPGGGPFLAYNSDGTVSPQILESTQIDTTNEEGRSLLNKATHFNPVDLVCYIHDINGKSFNLPEYVDPATGFISNKSRKGIEIKALELPGLWNGAMSDWNTIFVEVPSSTFNPVKTVNDLLREAHQS